MDQQEQVFEQDFKKEARPGGPFLMQLLFREPAQLPDKERMCSVMTRRLGPVECFWHDEKGAGFAAQNYHSQFKDGAVPPQLMITSCSSFCGADFDAFQKSQMWDCMEDRDRIFAECQYQVIATDLLAAGLSAKERAQLDMDFMEALVELYPACEAVYFQTSGKLFPIARIREHQIPKEDRFVYFAVNARFFHIQGTGDMLVDTVGMSTLFLPDVQYHFHGMDPNWVVNHAYHMASYLLDNDNPIQDGDTIDGMKDGKMNRAIQWECRYEEALVQPVREVIDVCMGPYASGNREQREED